MRARQTLPDLWLFSDARNDAVLETALHRLPPGSGFVFRHYHLTLAARRARFDELAAVCRAKRHLTVIGGDRVTALAWGADGIYGDPTKLSRGDDGLLRLATVHDAREIALADRARVDAMFLSPVYPTRSHPGGPSLGSNEFLALAARARAPVIALGGMDAQRAADLGWPRWGAIDGLS